MWQRQGSALKVEVVDEAEPAFAPELLLRLQPWHRVFLDNLGDLIWPRRLPPLRLISWPAAPWPDVLVPSRLPWRGLSQSVLLHAMAIAAVWWLGRYLPRYEMVIQRPVFHANEVIYYSPSEYLPPLDTGRAKAEQPLKGEPAYAPQPIISVPPEADNRTQTIVTPPDVRLKHDVPLPNMVEWSPKSIAVPMEATARQTADLKIPWLGQQVVAPAPEVDRATQRQAPALQTSVAAPAPEVGGGFQRPVIGAPEVSVVAPPPSVLSGSSRRVGDINIGPSQVIEPAPRLPVSEQRTLAGGGRPGPAAGGANVVAPPPSTQGLGVSGTGGRQIIALSVHPAPPGEPIPQGNRRGTFAATPQGKPGAAGTPDAPAGRVAGGNGAIGHGDGNGAGSARSAGGAPPGLLVGEPPKNSTTSTVAGQGGADPALSATVTPPRLTESRKPATPVAPENATAAEREVFGNRRFYSMTLNLPNLNSAGGSWIVHFAELQENKGPGELSGPIARRTADPAYPLELMRRNIHGTVTLYALINSDGTVGSVRVLNGVNDQLDEAAKSALMKWQFLPAMKNGNAVALEAVVRVPFRPFRF